MLVQAGGDDGDEGDEGEEGSEGEEEGYEEAEPGLEAIMVRNRGCQAQQTAGQGTLVSKRLMARTETGQIQEQQAVYCAVLCFFHSATQLTGTLKHPALLSGQWRPAPSL